jgi:hypothetical protein
MPSKPVNAFVQPTSYRGGFSVSRFLGGLGGFVGACVRQELLGIMGFGAR